MKRLSRRLPLHLVSLGLVFLFSLHVVEWIEIPLLDTFERNLYDLRLNLTTPNTRDDRIVIVDIDEKSLAREGHWPWRRDKLAGLIDRLFGQYRIRLLGFDVVFAERFDDAALSLLDQLLAGEHSANAGLRGTLESLRPSLEHDRRFADSMKGRPVVLGYVVSDRPGRDSVGVLPAPAFEMSPDEPALASVLAVNRHTGNLRELQEAAVAAGFFVNPLVDADGIYRRLPMLLRQDGKVYESVPLALFRALLGSPPIQLEIGGDYGDAGRKIEALVMEGFRIPTDARSAALIPFLGKQGSFSYISATDVLNGTIPVERLQDRIVLVGATAAGLLDMRATPVQAVFPGVEINANLLAAMLDQTFKERPAWILGVELLQILLAGLILSVFAPRLSAALGTLLTLLVLFALLGLNYFSWQKGNLAIESAAPLTLVFLLYSIQMFFGFFLESRSKKHLAGLFGQYVPAELVDEMSRQESDFGLCGETREMTVLFSDVRGFTTLSESVPPHQLSLLMNELLTPLTRVIHQRKGTIDKYMGDAIMAFWGAPLHDAHHARHGVEAGLDLLQAVREIQAAFKERGWPPVKLGVGINTGPMCVGNMGSEFRMAYTVLGDAVNLGSRLEGLTKQYGVYFIVSETTRAATPEFAYRELDCVRVKGKNEPVAIFEPLGKVEDLSESEREELNRHDAALMLYRQQRWREARESFDSLALEHPERMIYAIYLERIALYEREPPGADWDGAFTHHSK